MLARLDKGCEFLNDLARHVGQDSVEYDRFFAGWLRIKDEYERVHDQITILEAREKFAEWLKKQSAPKARIAPTIGGLKKE